MYFRLCIKRTNKHNTSIMKKNLSLKARFFAFFLLLVGMAQVLFAQKVAIIDAGSSGSRLFIYEINVDGTKKVNLLYPLNAQQKSASKGKALSKIANHTDSVKVFLHDMTSKYQCDSIDLYILATAGMRLKPKAQADSIYAKMMQQHDINGYYVKSAMTISGQYEGLYGWLAANYDNGRIGFSKSGTQKSLKYTGEPCGILEIGGASMQLAFPTEESHPDCLTRPGINHIYCKSYLGGGVDQIFLNTKKGKRYKFHLKLDDVSDLYGENMSFWGLGIPVNNVINGIAEQEQKKTYKKKINAYIKSLNDFEDSMKNYHPRINSHYIKWVSKKMDLNGKLVSPNTDSSWTVGAAIDIIINKVTPEGFDHVTRK